MRATARTDRLETPVPDFCGPRLAVDSHPEHDACLVLARGELDTATRDIGSTATTARHHPVTVVRLSGELDIAARDHCSAVCTAGNAVDVTVDLCDVIFMDCSGYGTLMAARLALSQRQGSLEIRNAHGQPARLLALVGELESPRVPR